MSDALASTPLSSRSGLQIAGRYDLHRLVPEADLSPDRGLLGPGAERGRAAFAERGGDLDPLLKGLSLLHIGGLDSPDALARIGLDPAGVRRLLEDAGLSADLVAGRGSPIPLLVADALRGSLDDYLARSALERHDDGWIADFHRFMMLDASFEASQPLQFFLGLVDGREGDPAILAEMMSAVRDERAMRRFLEREEGALAAQGLQNLLEFSEELDSCLADSERFPLFRGLIWLHYGYWYGVHGERLSDLAAWADAVRYQAAHFDSVPDGIGPLRLLFDRMTDLEHHPRQALAACADTLAPWLRRVDGSLQPAGTGPSRRLQRPETSKIRNFGLLAGTDFWKSAVTERMLALALDGHRRLADPVPEGPIAAAAATCSWNEHRINIVRTPPDLHFTAEVERSMRILDGAIVLFDGAAGFEPPAEAAWRQADKYRVPRIAFVNRLERPGAGFQACLDMMRDVLGVRTMPLQLPIGEGADFTGIVDLVANRALVWTDAGPEPFEIRKIPDQMQDACAEARLALIEMAVEQDDDAMEAYLQGREPDVAMLRKLIRKGSLSFSFVPVLAGSSFSNIGIQPLLDAAVDYLPSPLDVPAATGVKLDGEIRDSRPADDDTPFAALAFNLAGDPIAETLVLARIYSGTLRAGSMILDSSIRAIGSVGRILILRGSDREEVEEAGAGEIVALAGLSNVGAGDTLCAPEAPILLERAADPQPLIQTMVEPRTQDDRERLGPALERLAREDRSILVWSDPESGMTLVSAASEQRLEILIERLKREFNVDSRVGAPQVAYRESLGRPVELTYTHKKHSGGTGQFAEITVRVEPGAPGSGVRFLDEVRGGNIPDAYIPAVEKGMRDTAATGSLIGFPIVDFTIRLLDGKYHEADSSAFAFEIAGRGAMREAAHKSGIRLLEPFMEIEVVVPEDCLAEATADLHSRRGEIQETESLGNARSVRALVPLANMFGFDTELSAFSGGRGQYSMRFSHYQEVPLNVAAEVKADLA